MRLQTRLDILNTKTQRFTRPLTIIYFIYSPNGSSLTCFLPFISLGYLLPWKVLGNWENFCYCRDPFDILNNLASD